MKLAVALLVLLAALGAGGFGAMRLLRDGAAGEGACSATVRPGGDITAALFDAPEGGTVCLEAGTHRPFKTARARPGLTVRGSPDFRSVVEAERGTAIDLTDIERFTLEGIAVRGGNPAGIYVTRARDVALRDVRLGPAAIGIHAEGGATLSLDGVTISGTADFGLLLRRAATASARNLRVLDHRGIGIAAVDDPGAFTLQDGEVARAAHTGKGEGMVLNGFQRFALTAVTVRGGNPAGIYAARARELALREVTIDGALFGLHLDENANARIDGLAIPRSTGVGFLMQRGATIDARRVSILDAAGTGFSAINGAGPIALRDSEIARTAAAGFFAGVAGCAELPAASLDVPDCFRKDPLAQISTIKATLERVNVTDTRGPCLVFFPGVRAGVGDSVFTRCELTGIFAWGATVDVTRAVFEDNAEHALEYRAYPDPIGPILAPAAGTIESSAVRNTRPLVGEVAGIVFPTPVLGGGILAQGARLLIRNTEVTANADIGVSFVNKSSGEVVGSRITNNGSIAVCLLPDASVEVRDNTIAGNKDNALTACGGRPFAR